MQILYSGLSHWPTAKWIKLLLREFGAISNCEFNLWAEQCRFRLRGDGASNSKDLDDRSIDTDSGT